MSIVSSDLSIRALNTCDSTLVNVWMKTNQNEMSAQRDANTARWLYSKAEPKLFAPPQTPPFGGEGRPKFNQLEMVTAFTYKPSLVRIDARNFELSW